MKEEHIVFTGLLLGRMPIEHVWMAVDLYRCFMLHPDMKAPFKTIKDADIHV